MKITLLQGNRARESLHLRAKVNSFQLNVISSGVREAHLSKSIKNPYDLSLPLNVCASNIVVALIRARKGEIEYISHQM